MLLLLILINQDFSEILDYHRENKKDIAIIALLNHFPTTNCKIETGKNRNLLNLIEKPELIFRN